MQRWIGRPLVVMTIAVLLATSSSLWADKGKEKNKTGQREMVGTVSVQWKDDGDAGSITFTSFENDNEVPFQVNLDKNAKPLTDLDGLRIALTGSFSAGGAKNTVSVKSFTLALNGYLMKADGDEEEEPVPFAYLDVSEGEEEGEGRWTIVDDATARRMLQELEGQRVEVTATLDEEERIVIRSYHRVLTGQVRMESPSEEEDDEDPEEASPPVPVFVCQETGETHPIVQNEICRQLLKNCMNASVEVVATLGKPMSAPAVTVHRYTTLHSGRIQVQENDEGAVVSVELVPSGAAKGIRPLRIAQEGLGRELAEYHGERVTLTGAVREKDGVRWLKVRTIRS